MLQQLKPSYDLNLKGLINTLKTMDSSLESGVVLKEHQ